MLTLTALTVCMCMQVPLVSVDREKMIAIKTVAGQPEERAPLLPGENGFAVCTFADGATHSTETPNLFFSLAIKAAAKAKAKPKVKGKGKGKAKGKAKAKPKAKPEGKAKAKAKAPAAADSSDEGEDEKGEEEELEVDEEVEPSEDLAEAEQVEDGAVDEPDAKKAKQEPFFYTCNSCSIYI